MMEEMSHILITGFEIAAKMNFRHGCFAFKRLESTTQTKQHKKYLLEKEQF
jgi:hypothetical protein